MPKYANDWPLLVMFEVVDIVAHLYLPLSKYANDWLLLAKFKVMVHFYVDMEYPILTLVYVSW